MEQESQHTIKSNDGNHLECSRLDFRASERNETKSFDGHSMGSADNGPYSNKNDCFHGPTDLNLIHLISRNSTKPHSSNEISTKYCRPNVERIAHLLKQSMLSTNELEHTSSNGIVNECYQQLSRKMFDSSFIERLKRALRCCCKFDHNAEENCLNADFEQITNHFDEFADECMNEYSAQAANKHGSIISHLNDLKYDMNGFCSCASERQPVTQHVDVLILGAGLAGLGAATLLNSSKKCSYLILEAQPMAGGRVQTMPLKNLVQSSRPTVATTLIDAGAQWLHGKHNYLYHISEKYHLLDAHQSEEGLGMYAYANSKEIDPLLVKKIDFHIGILLGECERFARKLSTSASASSMNTEQDSSAYPDSVGHFLRERFQIYVDSIDSTKDREIAKDLFNWHMRFQIIDNSCLSLDHLSAKYWGKYSFNGESCQAHYNFTNGFGSLIEHLVDELDEQSIFYNKEVQEIGVRDNRIEPNNNHNFAQHNRNDAVISVKCSDGTMYTAHHVLVTFSLGVLKAHHANLFVPNVPKHIGLAIDSIGFGAINKIFLEFDTIWWNHLDGIQFIYEDNDIDGHSSNISWTRYMTGFDVMKPSCPNMLLGWVGGQGAIDMEQLSDNEIITDCIKLLSKFTNIHVPHPTKFYCTRWNSNRFVNGSYSFLSTDCDTNDTIAHNLLSQELFIDDFYASAVDKNVIPDTNAHHSENRTPIVAFAGEACHEKYFSTAHGAFLSGMEQAQKFLDCY